MTLHRKPKLTDTGRQRYQLAIDLKLKGLSYNEIGLQMGISRQRAQQLIRPPRIIYNLVRARANSKCQNCHVELTAGHVHHKENKEDYNDVENLEYLCISCHKLVHCGADQVNLKCKRCGKSWLSSVLQPKCCYHCRSYKWNKEFS